MNCKRVKKTLTAYISDELSKDKRRKVEMHLQICPSCQRELTSLQATREMLGAWVEINPPEELFSKFEARLAEEAKRGEVKSFLPFRWLSSPILGISFHSTKWIYVSATAVCFITAVILMFYILLSREERTLPKTAYDYDSYKQGDVWVSFYISEHEKTLKHAALQRTAALPREVPIRVPFRRENILYYDEISEGSEELKGQSGLILKSESGWEKEEAEEDVHKQILNGETLTLEEAGKSVSFDIIAPAVIRGEYHLDMVRKAKDKECVQLVYSNGLSVISLFEQPLEAREKLDRGDFRNIYFDLQRTKGVWQFWDGLQRNYSLISLVRWRFLN